MRKSLLNQVNQNSVEILFYGIIGKWMDIDVDVLVKELELLKKSGVTHLTFFVNSDGGEVPQGQTLRAYLKRNSFHVTWVVDGVAASMMAMILTDPAHIVIANKYSKFMYHRLEGMVRGNPDQVRSYAEMMDKFEEDLIDMFSTRTGIDKETTKKEYFGDTDKWLSAQEALELGLVNEVRDGYDGIITPETLSNSREVYNHFSSQLINLSHNQIDVKMKKIAALLNLNENSTEDAISTAVQNLINGNSKHAQDLATKDREISELKNQVKQHDEAKIKNLIDSAIQSKKFGEDLRETYTKLATTDFATAEKVINAMSGVAPVIDGIGKENGLQESEKNLTWDDHHKKGTLENLKRSNPTHFASLYKAKFGREYTA